MLEASYYESIDTVPIFQGAFMDRCCRESMEAPITKIFSSYNALLCTLFRRNTRPGGTEMDLQDLTNHISFFKQYSSSDFQKYLPSQMCTPEWHLLEHLVFDLKRVGSIEYLMANFFESSDRRFKEHYKKKS